MNVISDLTSRKVEFKALSCDPQILFLCAALWKAKDPGELCGRWAAKDAQGPGHGRQASFCWQPHQERAEQDRVQAVRGR